MPVDKDKFDSYKGSDPRPTNKKEQGLKNIDEGTPVRRDHLPSTSDHIPETATIPAQSSPRVARRREPLINLDGAGVLDTNPDDETSGRGQLSPPDTDTCAPYPPGAGGEPSKNKH